MELDDVGEPFQVTAMTSPETQAYEITIQHYCLNK